MSGRMRHGHVMFQEMSIQVKTFQFTNVGTKNVSSPEKVSRQYQISYLILYFIYFKKSTKIPLCQCRDRA